MAPEESGSARTLAEGGHLSLGPSHHVGQVERLEVGAHVLADIGPHGEQDALALVVAGAVLVEVAQVAGHDGAVDAADGQRPPSFPAARSSAMAQPNVTSRSPDPTWTLAKKAATTASGCALGLEKSNPPASMLSPDTTKVRSSMRPSAPNRLARRLPHARSSPVALWSGPGTTSVSPAKARNPSGPRRRVPTRTSSSGKANRARRNLSPMMARRTVSAREVRSTVASPISRDGVPPMRSRVEKE